MDAYAWAEPWPQVPRVTAFDALDPVARANPWPYYEWLHRHGAEGLYKLPHESNFYFVHRHEDVARVLLDPDTFSSQIFHDREIPFFPMMKGEEHRRIRGVLQSLFTPGTVRQLAPVISRVAQRHTQALLRAGTCDLVEAWASKIPLDMICALVGYPDDPSHLSVLRQQAVALNTEAFPVGGTGERQPAAQGGWRALAGMARQLSLLPPVVRLCRLIGVGGVRELSRYIGSSRVPEGCPRQRVSRGDPVARQRLIIAFLEDVARLFKQHIAQPDPGKIVSLLVDSHLQGKISLVEMIMAVLIVLLAGYGTTSALLGCAVYRLAREPGLLDKLQREPEALDPFVEELLRYYGPLQRTARRVEREVELGGTRLPKNAQLIVLLGAANCDPRKFGHPLHFDPERGNAAQHLAFGKGIHVCLGAQLARQEVRIALACLVGQIRSVELDPGRAPQYIVDRDTGMYGFESLPVVIHAR